MKCGLACIIALGMLVTLAVVPTTMANSLFCSYYNQIIDQDADLRPFDAALVSAASYRSSREEAHQCAEGMPQKDAIQMLYGQKVGEIIYSK